MTIIDDWRKKKLDDLMTCSEIGELKRQLIVVLEDIYQEIDNKEAIVSNL